MLQVSFIFRIFCVIFILASFTGSVNCKFIKGPNECSNTGRLRQGYKYEYAYDVTVSTGLTGDKTATIESQFSCRVVVSVPRKCEAVLQMRDCKLKSDGPTHVDFDSALHSSILAKELVRNPVYFQYNDGEVIDHQMVVYNTEPQHVANIKRGVVSLLQLRLASDYGEYPDTFAQNDVFGSCETSFKRPANPDYEVETYRDLVTCRLSHVSERQADILSFIKTVTGGHESGPISEVTYPFESDVKCKYSVTSTSTIKSAHCVQRQAYHPDPSDQNINGLPAIFIDQNMDLLLEIPLQSRVVDHSLVGRHWVDLAMEFDKKETVDNVDMMNLLEQTIITFLDQGGTANSLPAESFRKLIDVMRTRDEQDIKLMKDAVFSCRTAECDRPNLQDREDPQTLQSVEERLFLNALMSCGTDTCMLVFAECLRDDLVAGSEAKSTIYNMGLFHQPSSNLISLMIELCKAKDEASCWLPLSAMINRLTQTESYTTEAQNDVVDVRSYLSLMIGDKCHEGVLNGLPLPHKMVAEESLLTAIKALGNIGEAVTDIYDNIENGGQGIVIIQKLLNCVKNEQLNFIITRAAVQALSRIGIDSVLASELLQIAEDDSRSMVLRTAIIDALIFFDDEVTLRSLLDILDKTKYENIHTYIVTRVSSVLEGLEPQYKSLRSTLRQLVEERVLPDLGDNILSKSHYTQHSLFFTVPLTSLNIGRSLALNLVYTPASNVFHSLTFRCSNVVGNTSIPIFELTIDLEGVDTFLTLMKKKNGEGQESDELSSPLGIFKILKAYIQKVAGEQIPDYAHYNKKVKAALGEIFRLANIQRVSFPDAHVSFKVFDYEVGHLSSQSVLMMMKQNQQKGDPIKQVVGALSKGIHMILLRAYSQFDVYRVLPTVAGFPLETLVDATVVTKSLLDAKTDMSDFMSQGKHTVTNLLLKPSISVFFHAHMEVSIGNKSVSGIGLKAFGLGTGSWAGIIKYLPPRPSSDGMHDLHVVRNLWKDHYTFLDYRSHFYLSHNGKEYEISLPQTDDQCKTCLPDIYTRLSGHKICVTGVCTDSSNMGARHPLPFLGPYRIEGTITPTDDDLDYFSIKAKYKKKLSESKKPLGFNLDVAFEGPGAELSRQVSVNIDQNYTSNFLSIEASVPDAGLNYHLNQGRFVSDSLYHRKVASELTKHGKAWSTLIVEVKQNLVPKVSKPAGREPVEYNETDKMYHLNATFGKLSIDFNYRLFSPVPTYTVKDIVLTYYCDPSLRLFYALHPVPQLAAQRGHTSNYSYHQESNDSKTSFKDTWKGFYKMVILVPGQNITQTTDMVADLAGAHRLTDIYWTSGNKTEFTRMDANVYNKSTVEEFKYDYTMHIDSESHGQFELDLEGHVLGPRSNPFANLNFSTDVIFNSTSAIIHKRSRRSLNDVIDEVASMKTAVEEKAVQMFEAAKVKIFGYFGSSDTDTKTSESTSVSTTVASLVEEPAEETKAPELQVPFWKLPRWHIRLDSGTKMIPDMIVTPEGNKKMVGMEYQWMLEASLPVEDTQLLKANGSFYGGKINWMKVELDDTMHDLRLHWELEHYNNPEVFHHNHNWTLEESTRHSFDRSFSVRIDFKHHKHFEYDVILMSPRTNFSHHINYTMVDNGEHVIRARASLKSPTFALIYYESTDVIGRGLTTHINMTSTVLDAQFDLTKQVGRNGLQVNGQFHLNGRLPMLRGERTMTASLTLSRSAPPVCELTYVDGGGWGTNINIAMYGPKRIKIGVKVLPSRGVTVDDVENSVTWSLEIVEPRRMQHTITFSRETMQMVIYMARMLRQNIAVRIKMSGDIAADNIMVDLKDKKLPYIHQSMDSYLKTKLHHAMRSDPEGKKVKIFKLALGALDAVNEIWLDRPTVQLIRASYVDQAAARVIQSITTCLSDWILHPPFFMHQFVKFQVYPILHEAIETRTVTFSLPLFIVMPAFNKVPHMTVIEKEILAMVKRKVTGTETVKRDIAVFLEGRRIKTFDGLMYDITEPPRVACTYLLGADLRHGHFALTYSREGVTAVTDKYGLTLARDGSVVPIGDHTVGKVPYTSPDGQLSLDLHQGELHLSLAGGEADVAFNPDRDFYLVEMDRAMNNASIGLLGTNNFEKGDDLLLADGTMAETTEIFQNNYELTGSKKCQVSQPQSTSSCQRFRFPACLSLTDQWQPVLPCMLILNPEPFILQCQIAECEGRSGCSAVSAYLAACRHRGIDVGVPPACDACQANSGLDIVIIQSLHHSVVHDSDPMAAARSLVTSMHHLDLHVGVITYGGDSQWQKPQSLLLNGKLMERSKRAARDMKLSITGGSEETSAFAAILTAADFPFRSGTTKVILLMYHHQPPQENVDISALTETLLTRGIKFVSASSYPEFESKRVMGLSPHGTVIGRGKNITAPKDIYSDLVKTTKGLWLDLDVLVSGRSKKIKHVVRELNKLDTKTHQECST